MKLHFLGANRQVTGSCYCLESNGKRLLVDCGLYQERPFKDRNWSPLPIDPKLINAVAITHVHIDHIGLLPRRVNGGLFAPVYMTRPSADMAQIMLRDSARIQEEDAKYQRRRHKKEGREGPHPVEALYTDEDVSQTLPLIQPVDYGQPILIADEFSVTYHDAGHILGSSMLEVRTSDGKCIVFSGDIGQHDKPIVRDPTMLEHADFVVMESTYGDRNHPPHGDHEHMLAESITETIARGGNVVIPTFAVERAQELIYYLGRLASANRIPSVPIFLDSPMAANITEVFVKHRNCFDEEAIGMFHDGKKVLDIPNLNLSRTREQSRAINIDDRPSIIMATSGMCTAGRIKYHLRYNLPREESTILFVGYQANGSLGRIIKNGTNPVRIHGRQIEVKAEIKSLSGFSGHTDQQGLISWVSHFTPVPKRIFLSHGDEDAAQALKELIELNLETSVVVPEYQQVVEL